MQSSGDIWPKLAVRVVDIAALVVAMVWHELRFGCRDKIEEVCHGKSLDVLLRINGETLNAMRRGGVSSRILEHSIL